MCNRLCDLGNREWLSCDAGLSCSGGCPQESAGCRHPRPWLWQEDLFPSCHTHVAGQFSWLLGGNLSSWPCSLLVYSPDKVADVPRSKWSEREHAMSFFGSSFRSDMPVISAVPCWFYRWASCGVKADYPRLWRPGTQEPSGVVLESGCRIHLSVPSDSSKGEISVSWNPYISNPFLETLRSWDELWIQMQSLSTLVNCFCFFLSFNFYLWMSK